MEIGVLMRTDFHRWEYWNKIFDADSVVMYTYSQMRIKNPPIPEVPIKGVVPAICGPCLEFNGRGFFVEKVTNGLLTD